MEEKLNRFTEAMKEASVALRDIVSEAKDIPAAKYSVQQADMFLRTAYMWGTDANMQMVHMANLKAAAEKGDISGNVEGMTVIAGGQEKK